MTTPTTIAAALVAIAMCVAPFALQATALLHHVAAALPH